MSDVRKIFITKEVADMLEINPSYLLRIVKAMDLNESETRPAGKRNHLFTEEAVEKIRRKIAKK